MTESETVTLGHLVDSGFCVLKNNLREPLSKMQRSQMKEGPLYPYYGAANAIDEINDYKFEGFHLLVAEDGTVTSNGIAPMLQLVDGKFWVSNHAHVLQCASKWQTRLLYYLLCNVDINPYITGAVQPKLNKKNLLSILIRLPSSNIEQRAIAGILSALDDKIDLLHRQNQTLEALAQTLFRQWFIEEADDDWEEIILRDIADHIKINVNPQNFPEIIFHHYSIPAFDNGKTPVYELGKEIKSNKYHVPEKSILISKLNPRFPRVWMIQNEIKENSICSTEFQVIAPKDPQYYCFIYLFLKSQYTSNKLISAASGTSGSHQRVKPDDIFNLSSLIRNKTQIEKFNQEVSVMLEKIEENRRQINTLAMLRDILLPKLISGEVRVQ